MTLPARPLAAAVIALLALATLGLVALPLLLADGYSIVSNSVSEAAAQQTPGSWAGRLALLLSGLAVLLTALLRLRTWGWVATTAITAFGVMWMLTAVFSTRSWVAGTPFDETEDALHSVFASGMAIIVVGGVAIMLRRASSAADRWWALGLLVVASVLPLAGVLWTEWAGVFQRAMFLLTYVWLGREATCPFLLRSQRRGSATRRKSSG